MFYSHEVAREAEPCLKLGFDDKDRPSPRMEAFFLMYREVGTLVVMQFSHRTAGTSVFTVKVSGGNKILYQVPGTTTVGWTIQIKQ